MQITISTQLGETQLSKPPLGGWLPSVVFSQGQTDVLNAVADELIPGGNGFPAPSEVDIVGFFARYVTPASEEPKWYPFLQEDDFKERLDTLGPQFTDASSEDRIQTLRSIETNDNEFFMRVRDVTYYGYYSRPEVVRAIRANLPAGKDYRNSPQPFGYSDSIIDWDDELLSRVRGTYIRTEDVRPSDLPDDFPVHRTVRQGEGKRATGQQGPIPSGA